MSLTVTEKYNGGRPKNAPECDYDMLWKHWSRVQNDMVCFGGIFNNTHKTSFSSHNVADIVMKRKNLFFLELRGFASGVEHASGAPNRAKVSASGDYAMSRRGMSIDVNTAGEEFASHPNT